MIFRCTYCGREFESQEELTAHSLQAHGTDVQQIDGSDLDVDEETESVAGAVLTDYITGVQEAGFERTEEAEAFAAGSPEGESATSGPSPHVAQLAEPILVDFAGDPLVLHVVGHEPGEAHAGAQATAAGTRRTPTPPPDRQREKTLGDLLDPRDEYRCDQCGRVFPHREDLDRHRWIERGPRRVAS